MGRDRTDTAHRWLVARPRVKILVSFKRSDRYWLDVSPLQPRGRVLTCYIHRAWDAALWSESMAEDLRRCGRGNPDES